MKNAIDIKKPIQPTLRKMEMYDKEYFALEKVHIVRTIASIVSLSDNMKFKTRQINDEGVIEVIRIL